MDRQQRFLDLFLRHQHDVRGFIASIVRDWHRCDDVVQELAIVLWQRFDDYDPDRPFGAWARGIAANLVLRDFDRHRRALPLLSPEAIQALLVAYDAEPEPEPSREQEALRRCLARLSAPARRLIALRYGEDLAPSALAARVGSSLAAVKKALVRSRAALHACVAERLARPEDA
jgi:RNA polymerase sigma-70 factor (ECF subfamily)